MTGELNDRSFWEEVETPGIQTVPWGQETLNDRTL